MKICINQDICNIDFFINIYILGILIAYLHKKITVDDVQKLFFRPGIFEYLNKLSINKKILEIVLLGTELEDIESLVPEYLDEEIIKLINLSINNLDELELSNNISIYFQLQK